MSQYYDRCPGCGRRVRKGFSSGSFAPVYGCRNCGHRYCNECGRDRCPKCGRSGKNTVAKIRAT